MIKKIKQNIKNFIKKYNNTFTILILYKYLYVYILK